MVNIKRDLQVANLNGPKWSMTRVACGLEGASIIWRMRRSGLIDDLDNKHVSQFEMNLITSWFNPFHAKWYRMLAVVLNIPAWG